jgi:hypothetical protein
VTTLFLTSISEGVHAVNRNWQLVLVQMMFTMFSFTSFFIIVGSPLAMAAPSALSSAMRGAKCSVVPAASTA